MFFSKTTLQPQDCFRCFRRSYSRKLAAALAFALLWVAIVRNPGLHPYLDAGIQRSYSYDFVESYRDNWWSQGLGGGGYGDSSIPLEKIQVSFLTPDQRSEGEREADKLMK